MARPTGTYRLQLHPGFTLHDAADVLPHLVALGVSHVYLSPVLASVPGSTHGYDVVDHERVAEHLGGEAAWERFTARAAELELGVVVDIVPNHVSIEGDHNRRWLDVLESGPSSESADWFDIDWTGREELHRGVVVLPVLGDLYGEVLDAGELRIERDGQRFCAVCPGHRFPLAPGSIPLVLAPVADGLSATDDAARRLAFVTDAFASLGPAHTDRERRRRRDNLRVLHDLLADVLDDADVAGAVDAHLDVVNRDPGAVHAVLEEQHYRLAYWRAAAKELDYRRFFDIATLAAIRVEHDEVFEAVHRRALDWVGDGTVDGLRVDHPDGLADPRGYFRRLRAEAPAAWIVAEKILEGDEELPDDWPVDGTTGYDAMRLVTGILVDPAGLEALAAVERAVHERCGTEPVPPAVVVVQAKRAAVEELLAADLERVTDHALRVAESRPRHRDHPRVDVRRAIAALAVELDVYRTYVVPAESFVDDVDCERIDTAARLAAEHDPSIDPRLLRFLADVLTLRSVDPGEEADPEERHLIVRFQQLTGPATAKGLEDTAWYRLPRLIAANEVGGDPLEPAVGIEDLHRACIRRQELWPRTMTTLSTHDTKRSADVRARLTLLSEPASGWPALADKWVPRLLDRWPSGVEPHAPTVLIALQTIVGAWPIDRQRLRDHLLKASREAKERTTWTRQDEGFEAALDAVAAIVDDVATVAELSADLEPLVRWGRRNALTQTAIALLQPGVPDTYQGSEGEDLSLVDPDNRRPVDFDRLRADLDADGTDADDPATKVRLTAALLDLRRRRPGCFGAGVEGAYRPLAVDGPDADRVIAFARGDGVVLVTTRFPTRGAIDPATAVDLPPGRWVPVFGGVDPRTTGSGPEDRRPAVESGGQNGGGMHSGGRASVAKLLGDLPALVLETVDGGG